MLDNLTKVAIYARESSEDSASTISVEAQQQAALDYAEQRGIEVVEEYIDRATSVEAQLQAIREHADQNGLQSVRDYTDAGDSRDGFEQMMADATGENPPFQQILVYDLSLFSGSAEELAEQRGRLEANGVSLVSVREAV